MLGSTNDTTTESNDQEESFSPGSDDEFEEFEFHDGGFEGDDDSYNLGGREGEQKNMEQ